MIIFFFFFAQKYPIKILATTHLLTMLYMALRVISYPQIKMFLHMLSCLPLKNPLESEERLYFVKLNN